MLLRCVAIHPQLDGRGGVRHGPEVHDTHFVSARYEDLSTLAHERLERFVSMVEHLGEVTDAGEVAPLLVWAKGTT